LFLAAVFAAVGFESVSEGSLIAHYRLEGNANDETGNYNGVWRPNNPGSQAYGAALAPIGSQSGSFSGVTTTGNELLVSSSAIGLNSSNAFSIAFWVQTSATGDSFITKGTTSRGGYPDRDVDFFDAGASRLVFSAHSGGGETWRINSGYLVTDGNPHHIVGTWDGTTNAGGVRLVVDGGTPNGGQVFPATASALADNDHNDLFLGGTPNKGQYGLAGLLDDVRVYDHALTDQEIDAIFNIPEPSTLALTALGLLGLLACGRRRRR